MVDFPKPVDPFEHMKVPKIKPIGEEEENKDKKPLIQVPVSKKLFVYLSFLAVLANLLRLFTKKEPKKIIHTPLHKELMTIKSSLESLENQDLCNDPEFLNFFAFIWMKFLKDYSQYSLKNAAVSKLLRDLINEVNEYPKHTEFTLGFYISEFAGYKWVPFPYMEILQNLHLENKKDHENSHLKRWIDLLDAIMKKI